jgi:NAD(P)-dependent dehydrogenase (short-subunit alcohol dehydrogenase family)
MPDRPVAIVTAASRGIGLATALAFAQDGYRVTITARKEAAWPSRRTATA